MKNKTGSDPATAHKDRKKNKNEHLINERQDARYRKPCRGRDYRQLLFERIEADDKS